MSFAVALAWMGCAHLGVQSFAGEIHGAAVLGDLEKVKALLQADPKLVNSKDESERTPLFSSHKEIVEFLLANGANVNAKTIRGTTPLHQAVVPLHLEIAELLLKSGADANAHTKEGITPLFALMHRPVLGEEEIEKMREIAKLLLDHKADPDDAGFSNTTCLAEAAQNGYQKIVELFLANGAEINPKKTEAPLTMAIFMGNLEVVKLLLEHKEDVNIRAREGRNFHMKLVGGEDGLTAKTRAGRRCILLPITASKTMLNCFWRVAPTLT